MRPVLRAAAVSLICLSPAWAGKTDLASMPQKQSTGVIETPEVVYSAPNGFRPLELTLYRPANAAGNLPIVVFVHGGGWGGDPFHPLAGTPENQTSAADNDGTFFQLAARGYVVASVSYRLSAEAKFPAQIQDVKQAVRFLRTHAGEIGGDPDHMIAWGASAGGYLVALLGTSCGAQALEPVVQPGMPGSAPVAAGPVVSDCVNAVVDWYGPVDFATLDTMAAENHIKGPGPAMPHNAPNGPESTLLGCALPVCSRDLLREASALSYVSASAPPFLIMHGLADPAVPYEQSVALANALRAAGVKVEIKLVPGAAHLFMGIPKAASDALTLETFDWMDQLSGKK